MNLILIAACLAVCQAEKLNRGYLPPESAKTAGGNGDILQTPFRSQGSVDKSLPTGLPAGSYVNEFEGVVVDANTAGTRATHSGLGNSRVTYGSTDSKVGEAAFRETNLNSNKQEGTSKPGNKIQDETARPGHTVGHLSHHNVLPNVAGVRQPVLQSGDNRIPVLEVERFHATRDRTSNIIAYQNDIGITDFNYAFQTDNGISAAEIGVAVDGVRSKGGYSYTGDDGQVYTISYTADEGGYRPQGSHIPTPPPIPAEILKALEQNAKDEAAGIVDDGSYDAKKYNTDHTKGNRPNDYNDKDKHRTFERRPVFNVISTINQISHANKPNRDEDNQYNGQNQFPNVNLGYTVNDKQISNFSNIRNQYENEFDILTNNGFNNNGPISNFKELDITQSSNENKNQSLNVPLSQQKLQDEKEVPDSLNGRPNSYQAPIAAIQNQQQNNQAPFQKQTQAQPITYQSSINRANQKQQAVNKPENSFAISNNIQLRPNSYQTQTIVQGQQNFSKKGSIFQTQFQNNLNENQQNQQSFSSGITSTQFNANSQQATTVNKPHNNLLSQTFNNQANIFSKPTITQTKPSSYKTNSTSIIQTQKPISNVFSNPTQTRLTSYDSSIFGTSQNQQPIVNLNNVFSNPITNQKGPTYYDASTTGKIQQQQLVANSGSSFSNPTTTQVRPSSYDSSITGIIQKQQPIANPGNIFSTPNPTQVRPNSFDASISGIIKKQQQIVNFGNSFSNRTTTQARPSSYDGSISGTIQKQQPIANLGNVFSNPTSTQARPTSYDASISEKQQVIAKSENTFSKLTTTQPIPTLTTSNEESTTTDNSLLQQGTIQAKQGNQSLQLNLGFNNGFANADQSLDVQYEGELYEYPKPDKNLENVGNVASVTIIQKPIVNPGNGFPNPSTIQSRPNSYDGSFTGSVQQQQQPLNSANANQYNNKVSANKQNQITFSPDVTSAQFIKVNTQQGLTDNNGAIYSNSGSPFIINQSNIFSKPGVVDSNTYDASIAVSQQQQSNYNPANHGYNLQNNLNTNQLNQGSFNLEVTGAELLNANYQQMNKDSNSASTNFASTAINRYINGFDNQVKTEGKSYSQDTMTGGIQYQQAFNVIPTKNQFQNTENENQQNVNLGITSTPFQNINSQPRTEYKNNPHNSGSISQISSPLPASPNFESSYEQPQNFDSRPTPLTFTFNGDNVDKNNKGLVAVSSSQNQNDDFQSNFLHKKFSIRRHQQINQQALSDFLHSKNIANAPVIIPSYNKNQLATQPDFELSNLNSNNNAFQGLSPQQFLISSQLNRPNPTPQTFGVTGSDTKLFTAAPSRSLSTPKEDTIEVSPGTSSITQASISPFPSHVPSTSKELGTTLNSVLQTSILPSQAIGSSLGVNSMEIQSQQANLGFNLGFGNSGSSVNIQNEGEIYEYTKPDQNLPLPTKAPENSSQTNFKFASAKNNNRQTEIKNPIPNKILDTVQTTTQFLKPDNTKTESGIGPKLLPSRPNFISNSCCFSTQNKDTNQNQSNENNDSTSISTFQNAKEEFEGPKTQQTYDETGYHY